MADGTMQALRHGGSLPAYRPTTEPLSEQHSCTVRCAAFLRSTRAALYAASALSSWGDGLWLFAIGLYLITLAREDLFLTALFGFLASAIILLLGALIGDCIDRMPRLRALQGALFGRNGSVATCAIFVAVVMSYPTLFNHWQGVLCKVFIVTLAVSAHVFSCATRIIVNRDWLVVVCGSDRSRMTDMSSTLRQIELTTQIVAPVFFGFFASFTSLRVTAICVASWNVVSAVLEWLLLYRVYKRVPRLAVKAGQVSRVFKPTHEKMIDAKELENLSSTDDPTDIDQHDGQGGLFFNLRHMCFLCLRFGNSWKVYWQQRSFLSGLALALLYMTVISFDSITIGYAYSQCSAQPYQLGLVAAGGALSGICGTLLFPILRRRCGLILTGAFSFLIFSLCLLICVGSMFAPGSLFELIEKPTSVNLTKPFTLNSTTVVCPSEPQPWTISLKLMLFGIVASRAALWMSDLSVNQVYLETVDELQRGKVAGVQDSLNMLLDSVKFLLVIALPKSSQFGYLVILSWISVSTGAVLYWIFAARLRFHDMLPVHEPTDAEQPISLNAETAMNRLVTQDAHMEEIDLNSASALPLAPEQGALINDRPRGYEADTLQPGAGEGY